MSAGRRDEEEATEMENWNVERSATEFLTTGVTTFTGVSEVVNHMAQWLPARDALAASAVNWKWRQAIIGEQMDLSRVAELYRLKSEGDSAERDAGRSALKLRPGQRNEGSTIVPILICLLNVSFMLILLAAARVPFRDGGAMIGGGLGVYIPSIFILGLMTCHPGQWAVTFFSGVAIHMTNFILVMLFFEARSHLSLPTYTAEQLCHSMHGPYNRLQMSQLNALGSNRTGETSFIIDFGESTQFEFAECALNDYTYSPTRSTWPHGHDWNVIPRRSWSTSSRYRKRLGCLVINQSVFLPPAQYGYCALLLNLHKGSSAPSYERRCSYGMTTPSGKYLSVRPENRLFFRNGKKPYPYSSSRYSKYIYRSSPRVEYALPFYVDYWRTSSSRSCELVPKFSAWADRTPQGAAQLAWTWWVIAIILAATFPTVPLLWFNGFFDNFVIARGKRAAQELAQLEQMRNRWRSAQNGASPF